MIRFTVPGKPQGKARARSGMNGHYTPKKTKDYENLIAWSAKAAMIEQSGKELSGPVSVSVKCYVKPIKRLHGKVIGGDYATGKPDVDNVIKAILDGMNGVIYKDDSQISRMSCSKVYTYEDEKVEVAVFGAWEIEEYLK